MGTARSQPMSPSDKPQKPLKDSLSAPPQMTAAEAWAAMDDRETEMAWEMHRRRQADRQKSKSKG